MRICFSIIFILGVFQILSACDDPLPPGRPEPLTQDITLRGGEDGERKVNGADLKPGDCAALRHRTESLNGGGTDKYDYEVLGEMYDRSICSPLDTKKAYEAFRKAGEAWDFDWHPVTAWKLWYGDGVERDREEAKRQFRDWVVSLSRITDFDSIDSKLSSDFRDRTLPPPVIEAVAWIKSIVSQDEVTRAEWAVDLYAGDATYYDGTQIPPNRRIAWPLLVTVDVPYPHYYIGIARFRGATSIDERRSAFGSLLIPAYCGYIPAIETYIKYKNDPWEPELYSPYDVHFWTLITAHLGEDVDDLLAEQRRRFDEWTVQFAEEEAAYFLQNYPRCAKNLEGDDREPSETEP